jgi:CDP-diacylglycerol---glycerol-3-phosphate 3-phosphatidyltransferase
MPRFVEKTRYFNHMPLSHSNYGQLRRLMLNMNAGPHDGPDKSHINQQSFMSIYALKPRFQNLLRPLVTALHKAGATANQVTVAACIISIALGVWLCFQAESPRAFLLLPLWMFVRMAFNAVDGMLAREFGQRSNLGAYLNELTDVISDAFLYLPFAFLPGVSPLWVGIVIVLAVIVEMTGCVALLSGASRRYDGPFGKSDRAFVFGALALAVGSGAPPGPVMKWALPIMTALCVLTVVQRVRRGLQESGGK